MAIENVEAGRLAKYFGLATAVTLGLALIGGFIAMVVVKVSKAQKLAQERAKAEKERKLKEILQKSIETRNE